MHSQIKHLHSVEFPAYTGTRVMMMPFQMRHPASSMPPFLHQYRKLLYQIVEHCDDKTGIGYLTVDEADVTAGETHRQPGLHVDGRGGWGSQGTWGGSKKGGFYVASNVLGCRGWPGHFEGESLDDGDCSHMRSQIVEDAAIYMAANQLYWCNPMALHESIPHDVEVRRQFIRVSTPSDYPWYEGYTENPLGIKPTGEILPRRSGMDYRV